jgi:hypothetical protein
MLSALGAVPRVNGIWAQGRTKGKAQSYYHSERRGKPRFTSGGKAEAGSNDDF